MALDVMVVEDDPALRDVLALQLAHAGYAVRAVGDGDEALRGCRERAPDVVILDISLPGTSGLEICSALRAGSGSPAVVIVTARASEADVLLGFDAGADDYVVKPCRPREVIARVAAVARRLAPTSERSIMVRGGISIDLGAMRASIGGKELDLTRTELSLLIELARTPQVVRSRKELLLSVWNVANEGYARNVDCHVTRLRRKLQAAGLATSPLETVHGIGYRFVQ